MEWDHNAEEERNGVRYSWGCWPSSRLEAQKCVVPIGMLYSPLKRIERPAGMSSDPMQYDPVRCTNCGSVLNPWCQVDFQSKVWSCPFCLNRNPFSPHYADNISQENLPAELIPQYTTIEYELQPGPGRQATPPVFLFVMDTAVDRDELESLRDSLQQSINLIPDDALVGFITFGTMVQVWELGFTDCPKSYVFRGTKGIPSDQVAGLLGISRGGAPGAGMMGGAGAGGGGGGKFLTHSL